jgi:nicotinate-nucleotide pyrophosphorylase (carboxylating)
MMTTPSREAVERIVGLALLEDAPWGDLTSQAFVPASARVRAQLVAREDGVFCGEDVFRAAMSLTDAAIETRFLTADGEHFTKGAVLASVLGPAQAVLQAERVALNFVQRLSGIATLTAHYVLATAGTTARITDTRKTTPGLRLLERYAVRCGGGHNHRFSLSDAVMVKDNHLAVRAACGELGGGAGDVTEALRTARASLPHTTHFEVEVDRLDQIEAVLAAGVNTILLDNFTCNELSAGVRQVAGRALVEASGGVTLDRIADIAATGVDIISVGALTHSVRALDLGLDIDAGGGVETGIGGPS